MTSGVKIGYHTMIENYGIKSSADKYIVAFTEDEIGLMKAAFRLMEKKIKKLETNDIIQHNGMEHKISNQRATMSILFSRLEWALQRTSFVELPDISEHEDPCPDGHRFLSSGHPDGPTPGTLCECGLMRKGP